MSLPRSSARHLPSALTALLAVIGILIVVVAIVYFVEPAHSLPSFFPGHTKHGGKARTKHGIVALVVGVVVLLVAWWGAGRKRR